MDVSGADRRRAHGSGDHQCPPVGGLVRPWKVPVEKRLHPVEAPVSGGAWCLALTPGEAEPGRVMLRP